MQFNWLKAMATWKWSLNLSLIQIEYNVVMIKYNNYYYIKNTREFCHLNLFDNIVPYCTMGRWHEWNPTIAVRGQSNLIVPVQLVWSQPH